MSYMQGQGRLRKLLAGNARSRQTPGGTPPTVPDGRRRQDAPGETLVGGGSDGGHIAPAHVAQVLIDATAIMDEQRARLAEIRNLITEHDEMMYELGSGQAAVYAINQVRRVVQW